MNGFPKTVRVAGVPYTVTLCSGADLLDEDVAKVALGARGFQVGGSPRANARA